MKKTLLKLSTATLFLVNLTACNFFGPVLPEKSIAGTWENVLQYDKESKVTTTLEIEELKVKTMNEKEKLFNATMKSKLDGKESDTLKLKDSEIKLSGSFQGDVLDVTDVESNSDNITSRSRFVLSKDGKLLTLSPGEVKFRKKEK